MVFKAAPKIILVRRLKYNNIKKQKKATNRSKMKEIEKISGAIKLYYFRRSETLSPYPSIAFFVLVFFLFLFSIAGLLPLFIQFLCWVFFLFSLSHLHSLYKYTFFFNRPFTLIPHIRISLE